MYVYAPKGQTEPGTELWVHKLGFGKDVPLLNCMPTQTNPGQTNTNFSQKKGHIHNFIKVWGKMKNQSIHKVT